MKGRRALETGVDAVDFEPARLLFAGGEAAEILRAAARALESREAAADAWERVVGAELLAVARVESFKRGTLLIAVEDAAACYCLRRQALVLRRSLVMLLPRLKDLRFVLRSTSGP